MKFHIRPKEIVKDKPDITLCGYYKQPWMYSGPAFLSKDDIKNPPKYACKKCLKKYMVNPHP